MIFYFLIVSMIWNAICCFIWKSDDWMNLGFKMIYFILAFASMYILVKGY